LHALVFTSSVQRGFGAGARVAIAPLLTDVPIVTAAVLAVGALPSGVLPLLAGGGGAFIVLLGVAAIKGAGEAGTAAPMSDLWSGVVANALNPHPWLFWLGVGGPLLIDAWRSGPERAAAFLAAFYALLVGTKLAMAFVFARAGSRLGERARRRAVIVGGALLIGLGGFLIWEAATGRFS
jgi:threonine/homoserine/homoserine lactone efflux protein